MGLPVANCHTTRISPPMEKAIADVMVGESLKLTFLLRTVKRLNVTAAIRAKEILKAFAPAFGSNITPMPITQNTVARVLKRVIFSFKTKVASMRVVIEFTEKTMAITAGEGASFTAYCKESILIHIHNMPKAPNMPISFMVRLMFFLLMSA